MEGPNSSATSESTPTENERTWGMLAHLSAFAALIIPFAGQVIGINVLGVYLVSTTRGKQSAFVAANAKEALNFNISVTLAALFSAILLIVHVGAVLSAAVFIVWLVMTLIAAIKASEGHTYRYPFSLRLVK
jgi:uncharacterized Tic20 family protein